METWKVRQRHLLRILNDRFGNSQTALAEAIDRSESYVWQLCYGKQPRFGEKIARHIEAKLQLHEYFLDNGAIDKRELSPIELQEDVLRWVIEKTEDVLKSNGMAMQSDKKARLFVVLYKYVLSRGGDDGGCEEIIKLAA